MASYFVACHAQPDGAYAVHDRSRCPPGCFPAGAAKEYLGEFDEVTQAVLVARLLYAHACGCPCCLDAIAERPVASDEPGAALTPLRT